MMNSAPIHPAHLNVMSNRILLVEDDPDLGDLVAEYLQGEGWDVDLVGSGEEALRRVSDDYAAMVLDVMLPGISGFETLRRVRAEPATSKLSVVMLTARGDEVDRVLGLEMGADDYLPKPFSSRELAARLRAILRRSPTEAEEAPTPAANPDVLTVGDIELDIRTHQTRLSEVPLELTVLEFRLLELLLRHAGTIVSREQIANEVLGRDLLVYDRSVDTHMSNLRRKLTADGREDPIVTLRGTGYLFAVSSQS
jgi:DNA-binding response OmpR family regulator